MKNDNFDSIFGNRDRGLKTLIESQSSTETRLDPKKDKRNVKQLIKTRNLEIKKNNRKTR